MNVIDEIVDFRVEQIPAQSLANFNACDEARPRVWALIAKEKMELDDYLKLEHLVVLAKAKALAVIFRLNARGIAALNYLMSVTII